LGDTGYPSKPRLLTPFLQAGNRAEASMMVLHLGLLSTDEVEAPPSSSLVSMFPLARDGTEVVIPWKRRFHCLHGEIRLSPERTCRVIAACAVLHNIAKKRGLPDIEEDHMNNPPHPQPEQPVHHDDGNLVRNHVVHTYFQ
ncbi:putative nuclease HARBI1, partial [Asterias rubens]|uniref:putative nuclease HARBI1 n=1 Tax=Asterias rubens TaxID=7604 RepID=UPI001455D3FD